MTTYLWLLQQLWASSRYPESSYTYHTLAWICKQSKHTDLSIAKFSGMDRSNTRRRWWN